MLGETDFLYSRRVDDQLELVLDFQSDSGLFLGWRPEHGDFRCRGVSGEELGNAGVPSADPEDTALSCTDRVWTRVLNGSRTLVRDGFVRGGASALPDWVLGGAESFSAAFGWRSGPRTLLMFRRRPESKRIECQGLPLDTLPSDCTTSDRRRARPRPDAGPGPAAARVRRHFGALRSASG